MKRKASGNYLQIQIDKHESTRDSKPTMKIRESFPKRADNPITGTVVKYLFFLCVLISLFTTGGILYSLLSQAIGFFFEVPLMDFLTGTRWAPILKPFKKENMK